MAGQANLDVVSFRFDPAGMKELIAGPIGADLARRAVRVEGAAKQNATGRPGPNVVSGRLRDSITWRLGHDEKGIYADVGSAVVYARRIELGFTGTDSLGRNYDQPAYPYLAPALESARTT